MTSYDMTPLWDDEDYWAMYRAVVEHPKERTPRYILADWLDERGYPAEALKHRLNGAAQKEIAKVDYRGYVSIESSKLSNAAFWKEVARFHDAASRTVLIVSWQTKACEHYAKVDGPLGVMANPKLILDDANYQRLLAIPNLFGFFLQAVGTRFWADRIANDLSNVRALGWFHPQDDASKSLFSRLPKLEDLHFVTLYDTWKFANDCPSLKHLYVGGGYPLPDECEQIADWSLETLGVFFMARADETFQRPAFPSLIQKGKYLNLFHYGVRETSDEYVRGLGDLDQLERLESNMSAHNNIRFPRNLRQLDIAGNKLNDQQWPTALPTTLTDLTLNLYLVAEPILDALAPLDQLRRFAVALQHETQVNLNHVLTRPRLRIFKINISTLSEANLKRLIAIPSLRMLDLRQVPATTAMIQRLRKKAPHLIILGGE